MPRLATLIQLVGFVCVGLVYQSMIQSRRTAGISDVYTGWLSNLAPSEQILSSDGSLTAITTTTTKAAIEFRFRHEMRRFSPETVWNDLLAEASHKMILEKQQTNSSVLLAAMEVGMHRATQCVAAARAGLQAHCVEPSPISFQRVQTAVEKVHPEEVKERIHLYQVAAGDSSEGSLPFVMSGGTGDHVGAFDVWNMKPMSSQSPIRQQLVDVPSKRLDEIVETVENGVFVLKVDTQGFEPNVFAGLTDSIGQHRIKYILTEYWPRGMDLLAQQTSDDSCQVSVSMLQSLVDAGYTLFALGVQAHPKAPSGWKTLIPRVPLDSLERHCKFFLEMETQVPDPNYKFGYWTDILAVAPKTEPRLGNFKTATGEIIRKATGS